MRATETVKLHVPAYRKLLGLVAEVRRNGWTVLGLNRSDPPTSATVIAVALDKLQKEVEEKRGKKA